MRMNALTAGPVGGVSYLMRYTIFQPGRETSRGLLRFYTYTSVLAFYPFSVLVNSEWSFENRTPCRIDEFYCSMFTRNSRPCRIKVPHMCVARCWRLSSRKLFTISCTRILNFNAKWCWLSMNTFLPRMFDLLRP